MEKWQSIMDRDRYHFQDKVALVTGAASGIGRATALEFARCGARVVLADINEAKGEQTLKEIEKLGVQGLFRKTDVSRAQDVEALVKEVMDFYGRLDFAHNNAGTEGESAKIAVCPEEEWDRVIDVNLKGVWLCMKYEIPAMLKSGGGAIVNTSSIAGLAGLRKFAPYSASKHGIIGLTKTAVLEYAKSGIRINAICPGLIDTEMIEREMVARNVIKTGGAPAGISGWFERTKKALAYKFLEKDQPAGRMGQADEVARVVVWLCSEEASYINGAALPIDGGYLAE